jgi:preprotein translocase subunit SecA
MNRQREVIYEERRKVLFGHDMKDYIYEIMEEVLDYALDMYMNDKASADQWDFDSLRHYVESRFGIKVSDLKLDEMRKPDIKDALFERLKESYEAKEKAMGPEMMRHLERMVLLQVVDTRWKDHLYAMDSLREGIGLRAYGQRDPLIEYQHEAYDMFMDMISRIKEETIEYLFKMQAVKEEKPPSAVFDFSRQQLLHEEKSQFQGVAAASGPAEAPEEYSGQLPQGKVATYKREEPKVGRNDPCPCGSGKKYKKCCGK